MKNIRMLIVGLIAGALLATAGTALAESVIERVTATVRPDYKVKVDGKDVELQNAPLAYNGTTYVPLREAGEIFGYNVGFKSGTISLDQIEEKDVKQVEPVVPVETPVVETPEPPVILPPADDLPGVVESVSVDGLQAIGVTYLVDESARIITLSKGEKELLFPALEKDAVVITKENHGIERKSGIYYFSVSVLEYFQ
ncbi:stalk domain-containing protein [Paenibacillaceae bacterium WGS1546]|uniref:stalk domain-containing protein n=1 Tax=Cohnella sp. WGS1546 TaxID=3366810 RepID=UPI00372D2EF6